MLNDLDWWISSQWETFKTQTTYKRRDHARQAMKTSNLKPMFIVRYADDFKIFTTNYKSAEKIYHAVKDYLKGHLHLDISPEKSTITNLRKKSSEFLGFEIRAVKKKKRFVANSHVSRKKKEVIKSKIREKVALIRKQSLIEALNKYNSYVMGVKNYYKIATHINIDFNTIAYQISRTLYNRLNPIGRYGIPP